MKISKFHIQNFRSIKDSGEIEIQPFFSFIGENNCGKSNIIKAIDIFVSAGRSQITSSDFNDETNPIIIKCTFNQLNEDEKKIWRPYLVENSLILEKHIISNPKEEGSDRNKISTEFHGYKAEPKEVHLSIKKILDEHEDRPKWVDIVKSNDLPEYFLKDEKCNKTIYSKALERFLMENDVEYDQPDISSTQALGLQSNVVASLPDIYFLPAITDYSDEIDKRSSTTTFRRLMGSISDRIMKNDPRYRNLEEALNNIRELLNLLPTEGSSERMESLSQIENIITKTLQRLMPSVQKVAISVEIQEISNIFSAGVNLAVDDGIVTDVLSKGHGLQRCIVFSLLHTLILCEQDQISISETGLTSYPVKPIILLIEEPELYIHPQLGKLFFDVLRDFSSNDQVIYSTHSPIFIDAYESNHIAIVSKKDIEEGTKIRTCDNTAFEGLTEKKIFKNFTMLNSSINEMFFARKVLLVEGPQDLIAITAVLKKIGKISRRAEEIDWSIIPCGGKQSIPFFQRILNAFGIPYSVLHDTDIENNMSEDEKKAKNKENDVIAQLADNKNVYTYPIKLENSLGLSKNHFSDQYEAYQYFSEPNNITKEVEDIVTKVFM